MQPELISVILSPAFTLVGSFLGVLASQKLTNFRLERLEKKVDLHNNAVERLAIAQRDIEVANHRIKDLEEAIKNA